MGPKGVGRNSLVACYTDPSDVKRWPYAAIEPSTRVDPAGWATAYDATGRDDAAACARETGATLEFVDTDSTVRDLDLLRALVGDEQLHYLGFSYGTVIGQRYLELFPERVGRIVLDGVVDPTIDRAEFELQQDAGFELALTRFAEGCPARFGTDCLLPSGTESGLAAIRALVLRVDERPIPASDPADARVLTGSSLRTAIIQSLYDEATWPELVALLLELGAEPPVTDTAFSLADNCNDYVRGDGLNSNVSDAYNAINCLDRWGRA